jgi:RNA polymerase sigma-70 factor (ECF subfamily)
LHERDRTDVRVLDAAQAELTLCAPPQRARERADERVEQPACYPWPRVDPTSDSALYERWRAGDRRAGNELFERHFESVYRFFVHRANEDAIDLSQKTFLACVEARDRFRASSSFRTFLFGVARLELLAYWRRRRSKGPDPTVSSVRDLSPSPSAVLVERAEHRLLLEALRSIPIDLQIALELHYWERLRTSEIAEVLGVPEGTAKSRLRRAREALLEEMKRLEDDADRLRTTVANLDSWAESLKQEILADHRP